MSKKFPIIYEIILFMIAAILAGFLMYIVKLFLRDDTLSSSVARILAGLILMLIYRKKFKLSNAFSGFYIMLPALLLAIYKIPYHFISGGGDIGKITLSVLLAGLAPAVFEEILFRGIFIHNLKQRYQQPVTIVIISAIVFSFLHLTNMSAMDTSSMIVQLIMAFVVGVVLGAVYLRTEDIISVIIVHFSIDFIGDIFRGGTTTPAYFLIIMIILMLFEIIYGLNLLRKSD